MFQILGFEKINFTNPDTGEVINGVKFYLCGDAIDEKRGKGHSFISKFFASNRIEGVPDVDKIAEFKVSFTSKGEAKITGIKII